MNRKTNHRTAWQALAVWVAASALLGCARVQEPAVLLESPVPAAQQVAAQASAAAIHPKAYKTKIAIARFSNESNYGRSLMSTVELSQLGKQASDMLSSRLVLSGKFIVLERPELQNPRIILGNDLVVVEPPDVRAIMQDQAAEGTTLLGADSLIVGSVTEFGRSVGGKKGFMSSTKVQTARARVDMRIVDVTTGQAYFSATGTGEASTETGEIAGYGSKAAYDSTLNDRAIAAAISDVIDRIVSKLDERPWRTDVLEVRGDQVFITGGLHQGLEVGDVLDVMQSGERIKSGQTGAIITLPATKVGTIEVVSLFGDNELNEGSVCRVTSGTVDASQTKNLFVAEHQK